MPTDAQLIDALVATVKKHRGPMSYPDAVRVTAQREGVPMFAMQAILTHALNQDRLIVVPGGYLEVPK